MRLSPEILFDLFSVSLARPYRLSSGFSSSLLLSARFFKKHLFASLRRLFDGGKIKDANLKRLPQTAGDVEEETCLTKKDTVIFKMSP